MLVHGVASTVRTDTNNQQKSISDQRYGGNCDALQLETAQRLAGHSDLQLRSQSEPNDSWTQNAIFFGCRKKRKELEPNQTQAVYS